MKKARSRAMLIVALLFLIILALLIEEKSGLLRVGDKAPDFEILLSDGNVFRLKDVEGTRNIVLFFYPKDFTSGCTAQVCSIRDGYGELSQHDAVVFGVSGDDRESHEKFRGRYNLQFELVADTNRSLIKRYGVERLGGILKSTKRVTYIIDKRSIIRLAAHHELDMSAHLSDVLEVLPTLD